ncbi:hypothetical protein ZWY2020_001525 [Hordeum vulgare]|nr:hypothetical protein ZWY2020_001525 [Hordeum vulgare]
MAGQMLRRVAKPTYVAFDAVDDAIEAADPVQFSRHVFRRARGDLLGRLCSAADDDEAERLCGILDDVMAESFETLRLVPGAISRTRRGCARAASTTRARRLPRAASWPGGRPPSRTTSPRSRQPPMKKWRTPSSLRSHQPCPWRSCRSPSRRPEGGCPPTLTTTAISQASPASRWPEDGGNRQEGVDPASGFVDGDRAVLSWEDKMEAAKRKLRQGYQEAEDAKRRRRTQLVPAPKMMQPASQMQPIRRRTSSMVKKTFAVRTQLHMA